MGLTTKNNQTQTKKLYNARNCDSCCKSLVSWRRYLTPSITIGDLLGVIYKGYQNWKCEWTKRKNVIFRYVQNGMILHILRRKINQFCSVVQWFLFSWSRHNHGETIGDLWDIVYKVNTSKMWGNKRDEEGWVGLWVSGSSS